MKSHGFSSHVEIPELLSLFNGKNEKLTVKAKAIIKDKILECFINASSLSDIIFYIVEVTTIRNHDFLLRFCRKNKKEAESHGFVVVRGDRIKFVESVWNYE